MIISKNYNYDVYIIDQFNNDKFNKGILLNIGYFISKIHKNYDRYIFHDVDSYPTQEMFNWYFKYPKLNIHYASPWLKYKYSFDQFLGGVIGFNNTDFEKINGFPNTFQGWGGEDDAILFRCLTNNVSISRISHKKDKIINKSIVYSDELSKLSYILEEHDKPKPNEINTKKKENLLSDFKNWMKDGLLQINNLNIIYKKYNYNYFIKNYNKFNRNITNNFRNLSNYKVDKKMDNSKPNIYVFIVNYKI